MIDEKTKNLDLPLPHQDNLLDEDLPRLRESLRKVDAFAGQVGEGKADKTALQTETQAREAGDTVLARALEMESAARVVSHAALHEYIAAENHARLAADEAQAAADAALLREHDESSAAHAALTARLAGTVGAFDLTPFRPEDLPEFMPGWYFANGDRFLLDSPQGQVLQSLPANYKTDWGITLGADGEGEPTINLPSLFHTDGRGLFLRAGDPKNAVTLDAQQNITGDLGVVIDARSNGVFLPYKLLTNNIVPAGGAHWPASYQNMNASRQIRTASEVRVLHKEMTPVVFLGV